MAEEAERARLMTFARDEGRASRDAEVTSLSAEVQSLRMRLADVT